METRLGIRVAAVRAECEPSRPRASNRSNEWQSAGISADLPWSQQRLGRLLTMPRRASKTTTSISERHARPIPKACRRRDLINTRCPAPVQGRCPASGPGRRGLAPPRLEKSIAKLLSGGTASLNTRRPAGRCPDLGKPYSRRLRAGCIEEPIPYPQEREPDVFGFAQLSAIHQGLVTLTVFPHWHLLQRLKSPRKQDCPG